MKLPNEMRLPHKISFFNIVRLPIEDHIAANLVLRMRQYGSEGMPIMPATILMFVNNKYQTLLQIIIFTSCSRR